MSLAETAPTIERQKPDSHVLFMQKTDEVVESLKRTPSLFELKRSGATTKEAVEYTALTLSDSEDLGYSESQKNILGVIGHLGSFVTAQRRADELGSKRNEGQLNQDERSEMDYLKNYDLIPFNHAIKDLINTDSSLTKDQLDVSLARLYMKLFYKDDPVVTQADTDGIHDLNFRTAVSKDALNSISISTNGMRHEVAAESMLAVAGIDCDYHTSAQEDAKGADLFVYINDKWTYIDIKSSELSADKALAKRGDSHAVWTGLNPSSFTGAKDDQVNGIRLSDNEARKHADAFAKRIYAVAHR